MKNLERKVVALTGAGSGIGRSLAKKLSAEGCRLALSDVNEAGLAETVSMLGRPEIDVFSKVLDVSVEKNVFAYAEEVEARFGQVDIVINNAGVNQNGSVINTPIDDYRWIFEINFWGVVYGSKAFLPILMKRPEACLVNISSIFGMVGIPEQSAYCATKFAVRGFTESLRQEYLRAKSNVSIISVHPGGIKTNIIKNARIATADGAATQKEQEQFAKFFDKLAKTTPDEAARVIVEGIKKNSERVLIGNDAKFLDIIQRLLPGTYQKVLAKVIKDQHKVTDNGTDNGVTP